MYVYICLFLYNSIKFGKHIIFFCFLNWFIRQKDQLNSFKVKAIVSHNFESFKQFVLFFYSFLTLACHISGIFVRV